MRKLLPALVVVVLALGSLWYFGQRGDRDHLLGYVPADTPYVVANTSALPERVHAGLRKQLGAMGPMYRNMIDDAREFVRHGDADPKLLGVLDVLADEFEGDDIERTLTDIGLGIAPNMVVYGHGLVPVVRVVLDDAARFEAFLGRVEAGAGEPLAVIEVGASTVRRMPLADTGVSLLLMLDDGQLVVTLAPDDTSPAVLRELLGLQLPQRSLADTRGLRAFNRDYGFEPHYSGYLDHQRLVEIIAAAPTPIESAFLSALGIEKPAPTPTCHREFTALAAAWPRTAMGYTRLDSSVQEARIVMEARDDIAESLMSLRAPMPGAAARAPDSLVDAGLAFRLANLPSVINRFADAVAADPWQCEVLAPLNEGFAGARQQMANPALFVAAPLLQSVYVSVEHFALGEAEGEMPDLGGVLAIGSENPASLIAMGQTFLPQLASLGLAPDRVPRPLDLAAFGLSAPAEVIMSERVLALAVGEAASARLTHALGTDDAWQPLLHIAVGSDFYRLLAEMTAGQMAMLDPEFPEDMDDDERAELIRAQERMQRDAAMMAEVYANLFRRMQLDIEATPRGIELRQRIELP